MTTDRPSSLWTPDRAGGDLTVDLGAVAGNYRLLKQKAGGAECAAVVKADAYGLGAAHVAPALERAGARRFFVAHVDEGIALRPHLGPQSRVFVLHGPRPHAAEACVEHRLCPVLNTLEQITLWRDRARTEGRVLDAAIQLDSGMSRFGLSARDVASLTADSGGLDGIRVVLVMSHLACADEPDAAANPAQRACFAALAARLPSASLSLAASSGIFLGSDYHFDLVRPGAALYGVAPNAAQPNPMAPVVRLGVRILQIREIEAGDGVGYGLTYRAAARKRIAIIGAGYADGLARRGAAGGCAWWGDIRLPVIGRISMDSLPLDISDVPEGDLSADMSVDLLGPRRSVDEMAAAAGTIGYEVLTALGRRDCRRYVNG